MNKKAKNFLSMQQNGKNIEIKITATSEEMAKKIFNAIQTLATEMVRFDLEQEWNENE